MSFQPTSSIRPVGSGAKVIAALREAAEKFPGDLERQAAWVLRQMIDKRNERTQTDGNSIGRHGSGD